MTRMDKTTTRVSVSAAWDPEDGVWYVSSSSLSGLQLEGASLQELYDQLPRAIADLLEARDPQDLSIDFKMESQTRQPFRSARSLLILSKRPYYSFRARPVRPMAQFPKRQSMPRSP
jgi:predicted RNase H-like HicB family nuclease